MALTRIELAYESVSIPTDIFDFLQAVDGLVEQHRVNTAICFQGFVPSDYVLTYQCLRALYDSHLLCGTRFCEWGSGISVVASLAAMIGYEAHGIEYDEQLCGVAEGIRRDFDVPVELVQGSFIPTGVEDLLDEAFATYNGELALHTEPDRAYGELGHGVDDFDLIFTYPWPNDLEVTQHIFDRCAAQGALLLAYYDTDTIALFRKA